MFDSGIGGLTVFKEVKKLLPREHIIYLGDTARVPYGNKSPQTVTSYALESAMFLLTKGVKILVIACNTSSALALNILKKKLPVPVLGVIDPGAREAEGLTRVKRIGVIGTNATIQSGAYEKAIKKRNPQISVVSKPCPLLVPIVEEGLEGHAIARLAVEMYLQEFKSIDIDTLVMGCTHYPILEQMIQDVMGKDVVVINTGKETAKDVRNVLDKAGMLSRTGSGGCDYFVTDSPDSFKRIGGRFLGERISNIKFIKSLDYKDFLLSA